MICLNSPLSPWPPSNVVVCAPLYTLPCLKSDCLSQHYLQGWGYRSAYLICYRCGRTVFKNRSKDFCPPLFSCIPSSLSLQHLGHVLHGGILSSIFLYLQLVNLGYSLSKLHLHTQFVGCTAKMVSKCWRPHTNRGFHIEWVEPILSLHGPLSAM